MKQVQFFRISNFCIFKLNTAGEKNKSQFAMTDYFSNFEIKSRNIKILLSWIVAEFIWLHLDSLFLGLTNFCISKLYNSGEKINLNLQ